MSDRLAIALLSHLASPLAPTGAERSLSLLASGLHARGQRIAVAVPGPWVEADRLRSTGIDVRTIPCRSCWLAYHDPRPWCVALGKWLRYAAPQRATGDLRRFVEELRADVVHVNCLPHLRGARAAAAARRPVVWHVREILPAGPRRRWWSRRLGRHATAIVAVSEAVAGWLRDEGLGGRLHVIPNGVETRAVAAGEAAEARARLGLPGDGVLIGLFGQLAPHKGALEFVAAARHAWARAPELRFAIAGSGPVPFRRRVRRAIDASGCAERFHLLPPQPAGEALAAASDAVCLATRTPDPLPRAALEAMAAGRPVVAFRCGGIGELVREGETGLLAAPGDVEALGDGFVRLAQDGALRAALGRAGARRAREEFSLERHVERMLALFRSLAR